MNYVKEVKLIKKDHCRITKYGRGRYKLDLVVGNQTFRIWAGSEIIESFHRANWFATELALALYKFKHN